jgi:LPPG:FO 2-phospho-L-lactate transferase
VALLSGGVGGARMARALNAVVPSDALTVIVNVGDDDSMYGLHVSPDVDTVLYTLAGVEGPHGWGRRGDTFEVMAELQALGVDTTFRLGDADLALCLRRTSHLAAGGSLSSFTAEVARTLGVGPRVVPVTDDRLRTKIRTREGEWLDFQEYFVIRGHRDRVAEVRFDGAATSVPAPGVLEAVASADVVVIAPSNPLLSIEPVLAVPGVRDAVADRPVVAAVSPFIGGKALKGPAASIMEDLGITPGTRAIAAAYRGLITHLFIDAADAHDAAEAGDAGVAVHPAHTRISDPGAGADFAADMLDRLGAALHPTRSR